MMTVICDGDNECGDANGLGDVGCCQMDWFHLGLLGPQASLEAHQPGLPTLLPPMHCSTSPSTHCSAIRWALRCTFLISTLTPTNPLANMRFRNMKVPRNKILEGQM